MPVSNTDDVIDSRDVIARIEELESELEGGTLDEDGGYTMADDDGDLTDMNDEYEELEALKKLAEDGEDSADWHHGETLINDSYFEDYARQLADDIGAVNGDESWPNNCIDWERAADELKTDYFSIDFGGTDFWLRA